VLAPARSISAGSGVRARRWDVIHPARQKLINVFFREFPRRQRGRGDATALQTNAHSPFVFDSGDRTSSQLFNTTRFSKPGVGPSRLLSLEIGTQLAFHCQLLIKENRIGFHFSLEERSDYPVDMFTGKWGASVCEFFLAKSYWNKLFPGNYFTSHFISCWSANKVAQSMIRPTMNRQTLTDLVNSTTLWMYGMVLRESIRIAPDLRKRRLVG
jgi:hypothetical protein